MSSRGTSKEGAGAAKARVAPGFVVDKELMILEFLGHMGPYVEFTPGAAALRLQKVVHPAVGKIVAEAAKEAFGACKPVRRRGVRFHRDDESRTVDITAAPTSHPKAGAECVEIRFEEVAGPTPHPERPAAAAASPQPDAVKSREEYLEEEIAALRRELGAATEAHDEARRLFAARLREVEEGKDKSVTELEQAYAELEANHEELQIAVSEKEEAELQEREEREFIEAVLDAAETLVLVMDRRGRILRANRACERAAGRPLRDARGGLVWSLIPADQRGEVKKVFEDLASGRYPSHFENDWVRRDGTRVRIAWSNTALTNSAGTVTHVISTGIDVTERRKAQAALQDSEARNRALVEAAPAGILAVDRANRIQAVNEAVERMFGYDRAELLGKPLDALLPKRFRKAHRKHQERFFEHPTSRTMGLEMALFGLAKDGREFPIEVGLGFFEATGGSYAVAFITDVTEKIRSQRTIEQNLNEIRDLAARLITVREDEQRRIARELHDGLVQQLVALKLDLAILARHPAMTEAGLLEDLRSVETEARHAAENARAISHELHPAALEQLGLVPALRSNAAQVQRSTGVAVQVEADGPVPPLPRDTALGLYRIAQEALWNAAAHSGAETVTLALRDVSYSLIVEVIDHGKGFDVAEVRGGRSLGLVSMEERARLIHAELDVESHPGQGTTVRVRAQLEPPK